jgi:hypothetical protein
MIYMSENGIITIDGPVEVWSEESTRFVCMVTLQTATGEVVRLFTASSETASGAQTAADKWVSSEQPDAIPYDRSNAKHKASKQAIEAKLDEKVVVTADDEANNEEFWEIFKSRHRGIARKLAFGPVSVTRRQWSEMQSIPGFSDGPPHARKALVLTESAK